MYEILVNTHINHNVHNTYKRRLTLWYICVYIANVLKTILWKCINAKLLSISQMVKQLVNKKIMHSKTTAIHMAMWIIIISWGNINGCIRYPSDMSYRVSLWII